MMLDEVEAWVETIWRTGIAPEPDLTVSEWADTHRMLPSTSAEPGRWQTDRVPYLREIQDCLSPSNSVDTVVFMKGAQIGGTEAGLNWVGYAIDHAPGVMLLVQPSIESIRRNTSVRIDPMIEATSILKSKIRPARSRDAGNTIFRKQFPGGMLVMTGANSATGLRSLPARYVFLDEIDAYPHDADGEGDPVNLAIQRTVTFRGRRKIFLVSTPTLKGLSRIEKAFLESDQRRYYVPCPHCDEMHLLEWANIQWPKGRRDLAHAVCQECGAAIEEHDKPAMLAAGEWRAHQSGQGRAAGFHLSSLYSPFETWAEIALEHGRVYQDPPRLQAWTNLKLAETWADQAGEAIDPTGLMQRREDWGGKLPTNVALLTAGVDVQGDRFEVQVLGWGRDEECWSIEHRVIYGDPSGPPVWETLDRFLKNRWEHTRAMPALAIRAACIDTGGHHTQAAYHFAQSRWGRHVWAIKGKGGQGVPIWPRRPSKTKLNVPLFLVGVDNGKDTLAARLRNVEPGPGCIHFPADREASYFEQLTAEHVITRYSMGRPKRAWLPKRDGARNEALDTFVYGLAALHGLRAMGLQLNREAQEVESHPIGDAMQHGNSTAIKRTERTIRSAWLASES